MAQELTPEAVLAGLEKGRTLPVYLFYGQSQLLREKVLTAFRDTFLAPEARDFNLHRFYADETDPGAILDTARSLPFLAQARLVIVRRTDGFSAAQLEGFLPYLENPAETTCLIFVAEKANFRIKFFQALRARGAAVHFKPPVDSQVIPWILRLAKELQLDIAPEACAYLQQMKGNRLSELYGELEKLALRHPETRVGVEEVKALAVESRSFTLFELVDAVSARKASEALRILHRYMEEEGRDGALKILGMLNRQVRLLCKTHEAQAAGMPPSALPSRLKLPPFICRKLSQQARTWPPAEIEAAIQLLYEADTRLKTGSQPHAIVESLLLELCT